MTSLCFSVVEFIVVRWEDLYVPCPPLSRKEKSALYLTIRTGVVIINTSKKEILLNASHAWFSPRFARRASTLLAGAHFFVRQKSRTHNCRILNIYWFIITAFFYLELDRLAGDSVLSFPRELILFLRGSRRWTERYEVLARRSLGGSLRP